MCRFIYPVQVYQIYKISIYTYFLTLCYIHKSIEKYILYIAYLKYHSVSKYNDLNDLSHDSILNIYVQNVRVRQT